MKKRAVDNAPKTQVVQLSEGSRLRLLAKYQVAQRAEIEYSDQLALVLEAMGLIGLYELNKVDLDAGLVTITATGLPLTSKPVTGLATNGNAKVEMNSLSPSIPPPQPVS